MLGREVEPATLKIVAGEARHLIGEYIPSKKNGIVRDHYEKLGFEVIQHKADGATQAELSLLRFVPAEIFIDVSEG